MEIMSSFFTKILGALVALGMIWTGHGTPVEKGNNTAEDVPVIVEKEEASAEAKSFTDKLYNIMPEDKNYMYSPASVKMALAMAANGAEGDTRKEILDTVGIDDLDAYNADTAAMIKKYSDTQIIRLNIANSIWLNTDTMPFGFSEKYKTTVRDFYSGEAREVTLKNAVSDVNKWVKEKTNGKIPSVINEPYDAALVNAIYFKANWQNEFNKNATKKDIFTDRNGKKTETDFMNMTNRFMYGEKDGVRVLELPYKTIISSMDEDTGRITNDRMENTDISMFILLSDNEIKEPEKTVTEMYNGGLTQKKTELSLPKFKIEYDRELTDDLQALGIKTAFSSNANFDEMFGRTNSSMCFSQVIHKTFIEVDEEGTEAAAVTAIAMKATSARPQPEEIIQFKADKPFTFLIRDNVSGETLFIGEYAFVE